jgi:hypothetical protein
LIQTSLLLKTPRKKSFIFLMSGIRWECKYFQYLLASIEYLFHIIHCSYGFPCKVLWYRWRKCHKKTKGVVCSSVVGIFFNTCKAHCLIFGNTRKYKAPNPGSDGKRQILYIKLNLHNVILVSVFCCVDVQDLQVYASSPELLFSFF